LALKDELKNVGFTALIFAAMYYIGKKLDGAWGVIFRRGSDR